MVIYMMINNNSNNKLFLFLSILNIYTLLSGSVVLFILYINILY